jgi:hypothetical protein
MSLGELSEHRLYWADSVKIDRTAPSNTITPDSVCSTQLRHWLLGLLAYTRCRHVCAVDSDRSSPLPNESPPPMGPAIASHSGDVDISQLPELVKHRRC